MFSKKPLLICVVGATGIGKTALAIQLANAFSTKIISADSRQFYKEMEIGTAVPSKQELTAATHYFIQHKSIFETYTVGDYEKEALQKLDEIFSTKKCAILVGGSGLYVDAVVKGLDYFPKVDVAIREQLNKDLITNGIEALQKELQEVDPSYYQQIDIHNPRRIIRALEVYRSSGAPYSSFLKSKTNVRPFNVIYIGIKATREITYNRINKRVDLMVQSGLVEEARKLHTHAHLNALQTVGYKELFQYFDEKTDLQFAIEEIKKNTRRFAKRQETWFKKNEAIVWFEYPITPQKVVEFIKNKTTV